MRQPQISIIMPVYNGERTLDRSINSVLMQTYKDFELLLIDDCSSDLSAEICQRYENQDDRVHYYAAEKNQGSFLGNLYLFENDLQKYVMCIDQDDWYEPNAIDVALSSIEKYNSEIVVFGHCINDNEKTKYQLSEMTLNNNDAMKMLIDDTTVQSYYWDKIYKSSVFVSGIKDSPSDNETFDDFKLMPFVFRYADNVKIITDVLYHYSVNANNFSNSTKRINLIYFLANSYWIRVDFLRKYYESILDDSDVLKISFSNTLGVYKEAILNGDSDKRKKVEHLLVSHKDLLNNSNLPFIKWIILQMIVRVRRG